MAFCTSCGDKLPPDAKFCENCGAPAEPATPSPAGPLAMDTAEVRQPIVPPRPSQKPFPALLIVGILVVVALVVAAVWFAGLPFLQDGQKSTAVTPAPTAVPLTVTTEPAMPPTTVVTPTVTVRKLDPRYAEYYDEIYTLGQTFAYGQKATFAHDLTTPPLFIKYNLTPEMIVREKVINIGLSSEQTINFTYADPNAWFEVKVIDADNGAVIEAKGFGKDYPDVTKSEFMVRTPGNYQIEMSGSKIYADISILKGKS